MKAMQDRASQSPILERFDEMGRLLTGDPAAKAEDGIRWLQEIGTALKVPSLGTYGLTKTEFPEIIAKAKSASSMKGNPIELTDNELLQILEMAL